SLNEIKHFLNEVSLKSHVYRRLYELQLLEKHLLILLLTSNDLKDDRQRRILLYIGTFSAFEQQALEIFFRLTRPVDQSKYDDVTEDGSQNIADVEVKILLDYRKLFLKNHKILGHRELFARFQEYNIMDLIFEMANKEQSLMKWRVVIHEIFFYMFHGLEPEDIMYDRKAESNSIAEKLLAKEQSKKRDRRLADQRSQLKTWTEVEDGIKKAVSIYDAVNGNIPREESIHNDPAEEMPTPKSCWFYSSKNLVEMSDCERDLLRTTASKFLIESFNSLNRSVRDEISANQNAYSKIYTFRLLYLVRFFLKLQELFLIKEKEESGLRNTNNISAGVRKSARNSPKYPETTLKVVYDALSYDGFVYIFDEIKELNQLNNLEDLELALECLQQMVHARNVEIMSSSSNIGDGVKAAVHHVENKLLLNLERVEFIVNLVEDSRDRPHRKPGDSYKERNIRVKYPRDVEHGKKYLKLEFSENDNSLRRNMFRQFEKKFVNEKVIDTYMAYINAYDVHEKYKCDFYAVNVMFERICVNQNSMDLFIKVKYLNVMSRILRAWDRIVNNLKAGNHEDPNLSPSQKDFLDLVKDVCNEIYKEMKVDTLFAPNYEMFSLFEEIDKVILSYTSFLERQKLQQDKEERFKHKVSKPQFTDKEREFHKKTSVKQLIRQGQLEHIKWLQETMIKLGCQRITEEQIAARKKVLSHSKGAEESQVPYDDYHIEGPYWIVPNTLSGKYLISQAELLGEYIKECQDELMERKSNESTKDLSIKWNDSDDTIESDEVTSDDDMEVAEKGNDSADNEDMESDCTLKSDVMMENIGDAPDVTIDTDVIMSDNDFILRSSQKRKWQNDDDLDACVLSVYS
ncbi:11037_t:CDS:10, partial [Acaulospora colombiana]